MNCHFDLMKCNPNGSISNRKVPSRSKKRSSNDKVATCKKNSSLVKQTMKSEIGENKVILNIPLRTKSEANCFEPWQVKHKRHKIQQSIIASALKPVASSIKLPCRILFTRLAPKKLDKHDNLPMSFKYIVDAVCSILTGNFISGKADSDERISIAYDQVETKEYSIKIEINYD